MINELIFTDIHIIEKDIEEISKIFDEILLIKKENNVNLIKILGDSFDRINPNPNEQDFFSEFLMKLNCETIILAANSHESITKTESVVNHYAILNNNVKIFKEWESSSLGQFLGHFSLIESAKSFGATRSKKELVQYRSVYLGHEHIYQKFDNICYPGAVRWINFDEIIDDKRRVIFNAFNSYGKNMEEKIIELKSPYPMKQYDVNGNLKEILKELDALDTKTKVKIRIFNFNDFKNYINDESRYEHKFFKYIRENKFETNKLEIKTDVKSEKTKESFLKYLDKNKVNNEVKDILKGVLK